MSSINEEALPVYTPSQFTEEATIHARANMPLLVFGSPGQGKTTIFEQIARELEYDMIISHPVVDSPIDYKGLGAIVETQKNGEKTKEARFLPFADLKRLLDTDRPTLHLADDLGPAPPMVQCAYGQLILNRAIDNHKISPTVRFVAATNRKQDKSGVIGIIEMLKDRFHTVCELRNSLNDWVKWAIRSKKIPYELISYVRYRPGVLDAFKPMADLSRTPTPRGLEQVADKMNAGIPKHLQLKSFSGTIGPQHAAEFVGFLRIYQELPDPDYVLMNPKDAEIPDPNQKPGSLIALCGALAARATENTIERMITYANRLPDEFSVAMVNDATTRNPKLTKNRAFIDWTVSHQDVIL